MCQTTDTKFVDESKESFCAYYISFLLNDMSSWSDFQISKFSAKFTDRLYNFCIAWNVFILLGRFPCCLECSQTFWFPDNLKNFRTNWKISGQSECHGRVLRWCSNHPTWGGSSQPQLNPNKPLPLAGRSLIKLRFLDALASLQVG